MARFLSVLWMMLFSCFVLHAQSAQVSDRGDKEAGDADVAPVSNVASATFADFDVNGDGVLNAADVIDIVKYVNGNPRTAFNAKKADINGDGTIDLEDAKMISSILTGGEMPVASTDDGDGKVGSIMRGDSVSNPDGPTK